MLGGLNTYAYVGANPLSRLGRLGLESTDLASVEGSCPCPGGVWDQELGDFQLSGSFGAYASITNVHLTCRNNPRLRCRMRQICIGGGLTLGITGSWNVSGAVYGMNDVRSHLGWSDQWTFVAEVPVYGAAGAEFRGGGGLSDGSYAGGLGLNEGWEAGGALIRCYVDNLQCSGCPQCKR